MPYLCTRLTGTPARIRPRLLPPQALRKFVLLEIICYLCAKIKKDMEELIDFGPIKDHSQNIIKVIGVGGGGCNAVRNMYREGVEGVTFAVCNTDSQALSQVEVPVKLMLGESGLGAGANPEIGRKEAENTTDSLEKLLDDGTKMVFVTAGMGGGTGTGAAPVVAEVARKKGILTVGVVTIPFYFEKKRKIIKALKGVDKLRKSVDALLIVNNERLCDIYADSDVTIKEAFKRADDILKDAVKGIAELITVHSDGGINLDFRDVETTVKDGGSAIMAMGRAKGQARVEKAIVNALDSPLLYGNSVEKAKRILFNIYTSEDYAMGVREMQEVDDFFDQLDPDIEVIWGTSTDNSLEEDVKVTILATGLEDGLQSQAYDEVHENEDAYYESLIPQLYKPVKRVREREESAAVQEPSFVVAAGEAPEPAEPVAVVSGMSASAADSGVSGKAATEPEAKAEGKLDAESEGDAEGNVVKTTPRPTVLDKWKDFINKVVKDVTE